MGYLIEEKLPDYEVRHIAINDTANIQELTPEIMREFVEKIVVHERSEPHKKKNYTQQVDVYFNFVGRV